MLSATTETAAAKTSNYTTVRKEQSPILSKLEKTSNYKQEVYIRTTDADGNAIYHRDLGNN